MMQKQTLSWCRDFEETWQDLEICQLPHVVLFIGWSRVEFPVSTDLSQDPLFERAIDKKWLVQTHQGQHATKGKLVSAVWVSDVHWIN